MENSFQIDGEIVYIDKERAPKEGSTMMLRDFCLEKATAGDSQHIKFQLKGNNCSKIDDFNPGDTVLVSFSLLGQEAKPKDDKFPCDTNPKKLNLFSPNCNAWKIELIKKGNFVRGAVSQQPAQTNAPSTEKSAALISAEKDERWINKIVNPKTNAAWTLDEIMNDVPF